MRFVRYLHSGVELYGLLIDDEIISLPPLAVAPEIPLPSTIEEFIELGEKGMGTVKQLMLDPTKTENESI